MIIAEAAKSSTRQQILSSLRLPNDYSDLRDLANSVNAGFKNNGTELEAATRLWVGNNIKVSKDYIETLEKYYKGDLANINFNESDAVDLINQWVKNSTHGYIDSIADKENVNSDTKIFLTSATYFKGVWSKSFSKENTYERCFNVPNEGCYKVPLMENTDRYKYNYIPALNADVVEVPYTGDRVSMLLLLPNDDGIEPIRSLARDMVFTPISSILSNLKEEEVILQIPKFNIENKLDLRPYLEEMGIKYLFNQWSDLSKGFPDDKLQVSSVMHNAKIEVNEEGTVAAAITGISIVPLMGISKPVFRADRPFIFLIVDRETNAILFGGRVLKVGVPDKKKDKPQQRQKRFHPIVDYIDFNPL